MKIIQVIYIVASLIAVRSYSQLKGCRGITRLAMSSAAKRPSKASSYRIFNAGSLPELLNPVSEDEAKQLAKVQDILMKAGLEAGSGGKAEGDGLISTQGSTEGADSLASKLVQGMLQSVEESTKGEPAAPSIDSSMVVWAEKADKLQEGVVLLNHWAQRAVLITSYDPKKGAKGYELNSLTMASPDDVIPAARAKFTYSWPPLSLEMELVDKKWQIAQVSDNVADQSIFKFIPEEVKQAPTVAWELIFLLLLSNDEVADQMVIQALLDTGICPRKGLISYMRLFKRVSAREEVLNAVPAYRRISSTEFTL